jgi:hypothetical protein
MGFEANILSHTKPSFIAVEYHTPPTIYKRQGHSLAAMLKIK